MKTIRVDDREDARTVTHVLCETYGYALEHCRLELGDYQLPGGTVLERKTLPDFALSIVDGRLFSQAYRLVTSQARCIMILEGIGSTPTCVSRNAFRGALISLAQTYGLPVLRTLNECDTAWCMNRLVQQKEVVGMKYGPLGSRKSKRCITRRLHVLRSLPGIGPRLATSLFDRFGSVCAVANSSVTELAEVSGIGLARAREIHETLHESRAAYIVPGRSS